MSGYVGSYQHQIDEKGRLSLPAQYRREDPEQTLVLVHVLPNALTLYPEKTWAEVEVRLRDMMRLQPQARPWLLGVMANAVEVVPDKQGRILIPQRLQDAVEIRNTVTLVGMLDRIELYAPEKFAATVAESVPDADRYAHQVFG